MSGARVELNLDWCSHQAAKYAVSHWHYSKTLPTPPLVKIGVWENKSFIGCVLFGRGNACNLNKQYGLRKAEIAELVRVALKDHRIPTSKIVSIATRMIRKHSPKLRLLVSYADLDQGHLGTIYQALGWVYCGWTKGGDRYRDKNGREWHTRMLSPTGWKKVYGRKRRVARPQDCDKITTLGRHKYLLPLDKEMRKIVEKMAKPYPKELPESVRSVNGSTLRSTK